MIETIAMAEEGKKNFKWSVKAGGTLPADSLEMNHASSKLHGLPLVADAVRRSSGRNLAKKVT